MWVEFLKDYDFEVMYHTGKANIIVDAFTRKSLHAASLIVKECDLLERFKDLNLTKQIIESQKINQLVQTHRE